MTKFSHYLLMFVYISKICVLLLLTIIYSGNLDVIRKMHSLNIFTDSVDTSLRIMNRLQSTMSEEFTRID